MEGLSLALNIKVLGGIILAILVPTLSSDGQFADRNRRLHLALGWHASSVFSEVGEICGIGVALVRILRKLKVCPLAHELMNEIEAISKARRFVEGRRHALLQWDQVRAIRFTAESTRAALNKENFGDRDAEMKASILDRAQRSYWAVEFPFVTRDGVCQSPESLCVKVYEDTAECEMELQL